MHKNLSPSGTVDGAFLFDNLNFNMPDMWTHVKQYDMTKQFCRDVPIYSNSKEQNISIHRC